jgi:hypothetical protein
MPYLRSVGGKQNAADALNSSVNVLKKSAAVATDATLGAIRNILGPDSVPYPTNSAPLEVTKDFSIFGDFLVYKESNTASEKLLLSHFLRNLAR